MALSNEQQEQVQHLKAYFDKSDHAVKSSGREMVFRTAKGIFGISDIDVVASFLVKIGVRDDDVFVDLGSGDGRIVLVAALFCRSIGLEYDEDLVRRSESSSQATGINASFVTGDYEDYEYRDATILFSYADHEFSPSFLEKLKREFRGSLYVYQGVFLPDDIKKGRTIWIGQTPIISYDFSTAL